MPARYVLIVISSLCFFCAPKIILASTEADATACDAAAKIASAEIGVPEYYLKAIARTESGISRGGSFSPWPWTVNVAGKGSYFQNKQAAQNHIVKSLHGGVRNVDIGCFQINLKWHGSRFDSVEHMLDPLENARYAAFFLRDLHTEFGDWEAAAGAYHSRHAEYSAQYLDRLKPILHNLHPEARVSPSRGGLSLNFARRGVQATISEPIARGSLFPQGAAAEGRFINRRDVRG